MVDSTSFRNYNLREASGELSTPGFSTEVKKRNDELGKNEFLNLLVTQLKNQDPLEPIKNEQLAVNLAQFSQLEQLISINDKIGTEGADLSSMAAYLGQEVTLNSVLTTVKNHDGGMIKFELPGDASSVKLELLDPVSGSVQETFELGAMQGGKHTVELSNLATSSGQYQVMVRAIGSSGVETQLPAKVAGVVNGFIPGPQPKLLINGVEYDPSEVIEVNLPSHEM